MANKIKFQRKGLPKKQEGVVLIVALIMVLLMTIVAVSSIRGSGLQEAMAGNMRDRNIAFQACESGIRDAENVIGITQNVLPAFNGTGGFFQDLTLLTPGTSVQYWTATDWAAKGLAISTNIPNTSARPRYAVETIVSDPYDASMGGGVDVASADTVPPRDFYRVSCLGYGLTTDAQVVAQSTYAR